MSQRSDYDVIVIGGGHAGCEAAAAVYRLGLRCLLITQDLEKIGAMSCNPAMGGVGKGHILREIDACGGLIARLSDRAAIHYRLLNRSRGPAVQGPRAQVDRVHYMQHMQSTFKDIFKDGCALLAAEVSALCFAGRRVTGVQTKEGTTIHADAVVLTAGTFLNGTIFLGEERRSAGRHGDKAAKDLAAQLISLGLKTSRLKTGTPPRLIKDSLAWDQLEKQAGDEQAVFLSAETQSLHLPQVACCVTQTNPKTHAIIRAHQHLSPVGQGKNSGIAVRYCPSIDDKVERFADRAHHTIYLEPEGLESPLVYPNGLSTALPRDVQRQIVHSLPGCEAAEIAQYGYAIEYDILQPQQLSHGLRLRDFEGLWCAGQINGTTGYEEAAGQGLMAGLNAGRSVLGQEAAVFDRSESYIGVMIDDLVCRGVSEPYRVFTSRAEYRLHLRFDKANIRLSPKARGWGLLDDAGWARFEARQDVRRHWQKFFSETVSPSRHWLRGGVAQEEGAKEPHLSYHEAFKRPNFNWQSSLDELRRDHALPPSVGEECRADALYAGYAKRQDRDIQQFRIEEHRLLPAHLDYTCIPGLSREACEKLSQHRPANMSVASRIDGVTVGALLAVMRYVQIHDRRGGVA